MTGYPGGEGQRRRQQRQIATGWAKEVRRRFSFTCKGRAGKATTSKGEMTMGDGNNVGGCDGETLWASSQIYTLSVFETSRVFVSVHQVCAIPKTPRGISLSCASLGVCRFSVSFSRIPLIELTVRVHECLTLCIDPRACDLMSLHATKN